MRTFLLTALLTSFALATPVTHYAKRWTCGGEAPAFSCEPNAGCKNEIAWGECAINDGLVACGDPTPNHTTPVSPCQSAAFSACEAKHC
ncbi:uncharacterized protein EI97DRAFT_436903 [Westerdykella ornata]|uniref:Uncharacterized protein n=1 Tax=Westerdykella ornata TaxID=318751 RepID=A0A6A6J9V2_WESOR|nr:uncharacterized protein EI97DRAFT_436903 [Westerdykella ornata]KAF2272406.1 hypothetical protein EI97DRAFT_436903 [Westerdykella ornata]